MQNYEGPRSRTVGHQRYNKKLKKLVKKVQKNTSREDLLDFFLNDLDELSDAKCIFVIEGYKNPKLKSQLKEDMWKTFTELDVFGQRKIEDNRWENYVNNWISNFHKFIITREIIKWVKENYNKEQYNYIKKAKDKYFTSLEELIVFLQNKMDVSFNENEINIISQFAHGFSKHSLFLNVLNAEYDVDCWASNYIPNIKRELKPLVDDEIVWITGVNLLRANSRQPMRGLFLLYSGKHISRPPVDSEQDWWLLSLFKECYSMASYRVGSEAHKIFLDRSKLINSISPSILAHEINNDISNASKSLNDILRKFELVINEHTQNNSLIMEVNSLSDRVDIEIKSPINRCLEVTDNLMLLQKDKGTEEVNIEEILDRCISVFDFQLGEIGAEVEIRKLSLKSKIIITDSSLLMHAIINILINAIEAISSENGQSDKTIVIELDFVENDKLPLKIRIKNSGNLIRKKDLKHIFELGVTTKNEGHGIGLSIVKSIIGYLNGEVEALYYENGAHFQIQLPIEIEKETGLFEEAKTHSKNINKQDH